VHCKWTLFPEILIHEMKTALNFVETIGSYARFGGRKVYLLLDLDYVSLLWQRISLGLNILSKVGNNR